MTQAKTKIEIEKVLENLRAIRLLKGIKVDSIAKGIGITKSSYSNIETGKSEITLTRLQAIADFLQINYTIILHGHTANFRHLASDSMDNILIDSNLLQNIVKMHDSIAKLAEKICEKI